MIARKRIAYGVAALLALVAAFSGGRACSEPAQPQIMRFGGGPGFAAGPAGVIARIVNNGPLTESSIIRPTGVSGALDNWAPTGITTARTVYVTLSGDAALSSIAAGQGDGRALRLCSAAASGAFKLTVGHESAGTAINQIRNPNQVSVVVPAGGCLDLSYSAGTVNRWVDKPGVGVYSSTVPALGSAASTGEWAQWDGAQWQSRKFNDYRSTYSEFTMECMNGGNTGGEYGGAVTGTGASIGAVAGVGRQGICDLQTGTTSTGASRLAHTGFAFALSSLSLFYFQSVLGIPTLSTAPEEFTVSHGCRDTSGVVDQANGCYFLYDRANVAASGCNTGNASKWQAVCADNGGRTKLLLDGTSQNGSCAAGAITTVDSPVAALTLPDTNIYNMEIVGTPSSVAFKINGTTRATITTNIPSVVTRFCGDSAAIIKSAGTTSRSLYVDRISANTTSSAARSP